MLKLSYTTFSIVSLFFFSVVYLAGRYGSIFQHIKQTFNESSSQLSAVMQLLMCSECFHPLLLELYTVYSVYGLI